MRKQIFSLILLGILCSIGNVWADTFTVDCTTTSSDALFSVTETTSQYDYESNWTSYNLIDMKTSSSITITNVRGASISAISAAGVADNNSNKTVNFTISDGTNSVTTSSGSWNNRKSSTSLTTKSFSSVASLKMGMGQTYTITNNSSSSYNAGVRFVITYTFPEYNVTHTLSYVTATSGETGANAATKGTAYSAVFAAADGYSLPENITVTIGGNTAVNGTDYNWNPETGAFQVPASKVTGAIVITIVGEVASTDPYITAGNVELAYNATNGTITYTVNNPVDGGVLSATKVGEADWLTSVGAPSEGSIALTTTANTGAERSATVRLTYTYNDNETATKDVTITQAIAEYAITYNAGANGTGEVAAGQKTYNVDFTLSSEKFTRAGYVQTGWATEDGGAKVYELGGSYTTNAAQTFYPYWANVVSFDMNGHGSAIPSSLNVETGGTASAPFVSDVANWVFSGWFTDQDCTAGNEWNFSTTISASRTLYAKWIEDPCTFRQSLSKIVLTSASEGTLSGFNNKEYAGTPVIGDLKNTTDAEVDDSHEGSETGYKLNSGGKSIVFATLKTGSFQEGDRVVVTITKQNDTRTVDGSKDIMTIYYGSSKDDATELTTIKGVSAAGTYSYRLTAADATAINTTASNKGIGLFRASSNGQNHYVYSVEITGCRDWTHTLTVSNAEWATLYLDFPAKVPTGLTGAYYVSGVDNGALTLETISANSVIPAHTGILVNADADDYVFTGSADDPVSIGTNLLHGELDGDNKTIGEGKHYHLSYDYIAETTTPDYSTIGFYYGAANGVPFIISQPNKAYLVIPESSPAPARFLLNEEENNATNIKSVEDNADVVKFIENGQLLIKKEGVVYDALGRKIR